MGNNQANWMSIDGKALASTVREPNGKNQNFQAILFNSEMGVVIHLKKDNEICALGSWKFFIATWVMEMTM